jgi:hypothetical protein
LTGLSRTNGFELRRAPHFIRHSNSAATTIATCTVSGRAVTVAEPAAPRPPGPLPDRNGQLCGNLWSARYYSSAAGLDLAWIIVLFGVEICFAAQRGTTRAQLVVRSLKFMRSAALLVLLVSGREAAAVGWIFQQMERLGCIGIKKKITRICVSKYSLTSRHHRRCPQPALSEQQPPRRPDRAH